MATKFKPGMSATLKSEFTGFKGKEPIADWGYQIGDTVTLTEYDSQDESWRVQKPGRSSGIWIKRKNLAPITEKASIEKKPIPSPFKVGDKVELIAPTADWASNDNVTTGVTYTVTDVTIPSKDQITPYIKVSGGSARGVYWIECKNFELYKQPKAETPKPKVMQAVCINPGSYNLKLTKGQIYNVQEAGSIGGDKFFTVLNPNGGKDPFNCWQERFTVITEPAKAETPAPVAQAPKKRFAVCIDMSDSTAKYTVGSVYEIEREDDKYYVFKAPNNNGAMYKWRFKEIEDKVAEPVPTPKKSEYTIKVVCIDNICYARKLTIGKTYMAKPSTNTGEEDLYMIETNDRGDKPGTTIAFMSRFTVVPEPKVGDTISAQWLNTKIFKQFYGYGSSAGLKPRWESKADVDFILDRKIAEIAMKDGRMAALISGTANIWIDMAELTKPTEAPGKKHIIPDIAKEIPAPVMGMFLMELNTLIEKYK